MWKLLSTTPGRKAGLSHIDVKIEENWDLSSIYLFIYLFDGMHELWGIVIGLRLQKCLKGYLISLHRIEQCRLKRHPVGCSTQMSTKLDSNIYNSRASLWGWKKQHSHFEVWFLFRSYKGIKPIMVHRIITFMLPTTQQPAAISQFTRIDFQSMF